MTMVAGATLLSSTSIWLSLPSYKLLNTELELSPSPSEGKKKKVIFDVTVTYNSFICVVS